MQTTGANKKISFSKNAIKLVNKKCERFQSYTSFISCAFSSSYSIEGSYKGLVTDVLRNKIANKFGNATELQYLYPCLRVKDTNVEEKQKQNNSKAFSIYRIANCLLNAKKKRPTVFSLSLQLEPTSECEINLIEGLFLLTCQLFQ